MPRDKDKTPPGLEKEHEFMYPDGTIDEMTQQEWIDRDKDAGLERVDEEEEPVEEPVIPE
jgi:hypothetical protein